MLSSSKCWTNVTQPKKFFLQKVFQKWLMTHNVDLLGQDSEKQQFCTYCTYITRRHRNWGRTNTCCFRFGFKYFFAFYGTNLLLLWNQSSSSSSSSSSSLEPVYVCVTKLGLVVVVVVKTPKKIWKWFLFKSELNLNVYSQAQIQ